MTDRGKEKRQRGPPPPPAMGGNVDVGTSKTGTQMFSILAIYLYL